MARLLKRKRKALWKMGTALVYGSPSGFLAGPQFGPVVAPLMFLLGSALMLTVQGPAAVVVRGPR
jgi:hypothetical protein